MAVMTWSENVFAQACCAGTSAVTPGRLALHDDALVGIQLKAGVGFGSFDSSGKYVASPRGASELDLEEDVFGAVRFLKRGQFALLVPFVETRRTSENRSEFGGGLGDVNGSVRYDFTWAGSSRFVPGIAALAGVTFPTGTPPDAPNLGALATGATGIGAYQISLGAALEQTFGAWLVSLSSFVVFRTARTVGSGVASIHERLGPQWTALTSVAYTFSNDSALALSASYTLEADATINGVDTIGTAHRLPALTVSGVWPMTDTWRLQGALFVNPPIPKFGLNQPANAGMLLTVVHTWM